MDARANLGCATTEELLHELEARMTISGRNDLGRDLVDISNALDDDALAYRTVDTG